MDDGFIFNRLRLCKKHKTLPDFYINDRCIAGCKSYSDYKGLASLGQVKLRKSDPGGKEMEAEEELLMGASIGFQRLCHLRHKAGQCPRYIPVEKLTNPAA